MFKIDSKTKLMALAVTTLFLSGTLVSLAANAGTPTIPPMRKNAVFTIGSKKLEIDGKTYAMDAAPYIDSNGRAQVSVRYLADVLGLKPVWNADTQQVVLEMSLSGGNGYEQLTIGSNKLVVDLPHQQPTVVTMDTAPVIIPPGRTMLPARWVVYPFGVGLYWDSLSRTVNLTMPD